MSNLHPDTSGNPADAHVEHIKSLEAEVEELRAIKFKRFADQECWIYQGDGEDYLESLVCPVVVSPAKMMELEKAQSQLANNKAWIDQLSSEKQRLTERVAELTTEVNVCHKQLSLAYGRTDELEQRVAELEREAESMRGLLNASQVARDRDMRERAGWEASEAQLLADNARLRELLRECAKYLPQFSQLSIDVNKAIGE